MDLRKISAARWAFVVGATAACAASAQCGNGNNAAAREADAALADIRQRTGGTFEARLRTNIGGLDFPAYAQRAPRAHDFQHDLALRGAILDLVRAPAVFERSDDPLARAAARLLAHADAYALLARPVFVVVDVVFADGSSVTARMRLGEGGTYVANSAVDASGHALPDFNDARRYPGRWYYAPDQADDRTAFIGHLRRLGATIASGSSNDGVIRCTWTPSTKTTCVEPL